MCIIVLTINPADIPKQTGGVKESEGIGQLRYGCICVVYQYSPNLGSLTYFLVGIINNKIMR